MTDQQDSNIDQLDQEHLQFLTDEIKDISQNLKAAKERETTRMPEDAFVNIYLPLFAGDEANPYNVDLANWRSVAGGLYRPVHVVDRQSGEILFTVPPIIDETILREYEQTARGSMPELVGQIRNVAAISPQRAMRLLDSGIGQRLKVIVGDDVARRDVSLKVLKTWNEIFARYGRPLIEVDGVEHEVPKTQSPAEELPIEFPSL